jgi:tetratricopeptide (TPR) repeat protein
LRFVFSILALAAFLAQAHGSIAQEPVKPADQTDACREVNDDRCLQVLGQGTDGYNEIDWDGPDTVVRSPLDFLCFDVDVELEKFRMTTAGIASGIPAASLTYQKALSGVQGLFASGEAAKGLAALRSGASNAGRSEALERVGALAAIQGDLSYALATLLARHEAAPNDPTILFSFAGALESAGMPNEAIAMLDKIASIGKKPDVAFGFQPEAALDYLRGYGLLMTGQLSESQALLGRAFATDPMLTDASYALAIAEQAQGGDPRKHMLQGLIRSYTGPFMHCGAQYDKDPLLFGAGRHALRAANPDDDTEDPVGPPADQLFNLSSGTPGVLPPLHHPANGLQLMQMVEEMVVEAPKFAQEATELGQKADEIYASQLSSRLNKESPDIQDITDQAICDLMSEIGASLKPLQRMRAVRETRHEEMNEAIERSKKAQEAKYEALGQSLTMEAHKALCRDIVSTNMNVRRVPINAFDVALRQHYRAWHKYATGLAGYITDETWRQYADLRIKAWGATLWANLYSAVIESYFEGSPGGREIYDPGPPLPKLPGPPADALWRCDPSTQKGGSRSFDSPSKLGAPDISIKASMDCDKASLRIDSDLAKSSFTDAVPVIYQMNLNDSIATQRTLKLPGFLVQPEGSLGVFGEATVSRTGDMTVYAGPKASAKGVGEVRDGVYITRDSEGIKEFGFRVDPPTKPGANSGLKKFEGDGMKFTIWSAPPRAPKFNPTTGLTIWGNQ